MKFYTFSQNNSGGTFDHDETRGIGHYVIIEAFSNIDAVSKALQIGLYFNGVADSIDCECCGDRWSEPWEFEVAEEPTIYSRPVKPCEKESDEPYISWGIPSYIHYIDGTIKKVASE